MYKYLDDCWLSQNLSTDRGFIAELLGLFAVQCEEAIGVFREPHGSSDLSRVRELAHKLKGSGGALGLAVVVERMSAVEEAVRGGVEPLSRVLDEGAIVLRGAMRDAEEYVEKNV